jgi:metal-sulfur cluster biosynthetic enzyme
MAISEDSVRETLKQVIDPELFVNIVDLGLIYLVELQEAADKVDVKIEMTMTSPACPAGPQLVSQRGRRGRASPAGLRT